MKYIIADPDDQCCRELKGMLEEHELMQFIASFSALGSCVNSIRGEPPDLAFIRLGSPALNGFQLAGLIRETNPEAKVVFLSSDAEYALDAFEEGADGFLMLPLERGKVGELIKQWG
jgi:two-component SAPR family response regulator